MASRMERYYDSEYEKNNRSQKNQDLYQTIYEDSRYTNIEGIADIEKTNEVDISKIKEMLKSREDYRNNKKYMQILNHSHTHSSYEEVEEDEDDRNYDIKDALSKAHNERGNNSINYHSLKNTQYNILKNIKLDNDNHPPQIENEEELKEIINTITSTSMLNKMGDKELCLDILDELKSSGDTIIGNSEEMNTLLKNKESKIEENSIDKSFFTNSIKIKDDDYEDLKDINNSLKHNNKLIRVILIILSLVIVIGGIIIAWTLLK